MARGDLAIRGARVVLADREADLDVIVRSGRIASLVEPDSGSAVEEIDARGLVVLPGAVDMHVHFNEPGRTEWEGWARGTAGAAAGGTTTVADMPLNSIPATLDGTAFDLKRVAGERSAIVDFALWGGLCPGYERRLRDLATRGAVGVKAFLADSGVPEFPRLPEGAMPDALRAAAEAGLLVAVHAEDEATVNERTAKLRKRGKDRASWAASRPPEAERRAVERAVAAAREAEAAVHVVHLGSADALAPLRAARARGMRITAETCPHYLAFDESDVKRLGPALKCAPPIRDAGNREALWRAVREGEIEHVASDHSPCAAEEKTKGERDIFLAWGGVSGVQSLLPAMLTEGAARGFGLVAIARLVATAPARLLGLHPRKGEIREGADADLALVDPTRAWTLEAAALQTASGISPYVGRAFTGQVVRTIVRGTTVYLDGQVVGRPGTGRFVRPS
ncbi:MAG TPA: allantoinase AllB [Candidatus Limnocylindrales bacterium]|nr:allantoinase AllB [Candidatus Limnocylindrales bacterium]